MSSQQQQPKTTPALFLQKTGDPAEILHLGEVQVPELGPDQVLLRMLAAPVNPSDKAALYGRYPVRFARVPLAAAAAGAEEVQVPGFEGLAEIVRVGSGVTHLAEGDWVLPEQAGFGTWRALVVAPAKGVTKIASRSDSAGLSLHAAATLVVNPPTAYRMLRDFVTLQPGDVVVQNAANSAVGQAVIQMARAMGVRTINVVRARPTAAEWEKTVASLVALGADAVVRDTTDDIDKLLADTAAWPRKPILALNAVGGGASAELLVRSLGTNGVMVTYGAMGDDPITLLPGPMLFKNLTLRGFWLSSWKKNASAQEYGHMLKELIGMYRSGTLTTPAIDEVPFPTSTTASPQERSAAERVLVDAVVRAGSGKKQLFVFKNKL